MIRALLIYAIIIVAALFGVTLALGVPLEWVAWTALVVEIVPLATWGGVKLARYMTREPREDWPRLTCDPVAPPLPPPAPRYSVEVLPAPAPRQISAAPKLLEAPKGKP